MKEETTRRAIPRRLRAAVFAAAVLAASACLPGCGSRTVVRGTVRDVAGEALPGVAVAVDGAEADLITDLQGRYAVRAGRGRAALTFMKTGYATARIEVEAPGGRVDAPEARLWPLPESEGVFLFSGYRYTELERPRPLAYMTADRGVVHGTPVTPAGEGVAPFGGGTAGAEGPLLAACKLPGYDARLVRLQRVAAKQTQGVRPGTSGPVLREVEEQVWVADTPVPATMESLDGQEHQLVRIEPVEPLTPGVYAVHWGVLDGLSGIEQRAFLFRVFDPLGGVEAQDEAGGGKDGAEEAEKERRRLENQKEMNKETDEGMG
ncbi:MAG: carboxypeptidase-like regulatory domain-containing protein [Candidatus Hydrogenedentes bacterium]|nr:carboxypeptidase-like regulatory domain-containing protein [Candidatus Hydrogenedentota bacterium]